MRLLFHYLAFLNLTDGLSTYYGLKNGQITEMNPLMVWIYEMDAVWFLVLKVSFSIFLYLFIVLKIVQATRLVKRLTVFASMLYTGVFGLHCLWIF